MNCHVVSALRYANHFCVSDLIADKSAVAVATAVLGPEDAPSYQQNPPLE